MAQAGFKCDNRKLFGAEFSKAIARAPPCLLFSCVTALRPFAAIRISIIRTRCPWQRQPLPY